MRLSCVLFCLAMFGVLASCASAQSRASAPIISDPQYFAPPVAQAAPAWSSADEAWYIRNRAFAMAGKILTVLGIATLLATWVPTDSSVALAVGVAAQYTGQIMWSASELKAAKQMRQRGFRVTKVPGILSVCGAILFSPLLWVAGPIQSARLRQSHSAVFAAHPSQAPISTFGFATQLKF